MKGGASRQRSILHVDLHPFFVSVERSLDPTLKARPVIVGGGQLGMVAAASAEARAKGVQPGQTLAKARRLCPDAVLRPGDLEAYAVFSEDVTALLLSHSRRVERPSADEAYLDLTPESADALSPVAVAEALRADLEGRLRIEASLGLASSRLAARRASSWARPRGLLVVFPGYESSLLAETALSELPELPPGLALALGRADIHTLGDVSRADDGLLTEILGPEGAAHLEDRARGFREPPIAVAAPPARVHAESLIRDPRHEFDGLEEVVASVAARAYRRLRPFPLRVGRITVEVRQGEESRRRDMTFASGLRDEAAICRAARELAAPLLAAAQPRAVRVGLSQLSSETAQGTLFPVAAR